MQVYSSLRQTWVWRFLAFKTKQKKTKRYLVPKPEMACGPFPRQNVHRERAPRWLMPGFRAYRRNLPGWSGLGPETQKQRGVRVWAGGDRPAQPQSKPLAHTGLALGRAGEPQDRVRPAPGSTRSPSRNPGNVAGPGSIWTASGQREESNLEFLGCFCTKSPKHFSPVKLKSTGVRRHLPTSYLSRPFAAKAPNPRCESTQTALPSSKDPFFVYEGGSPSPPGILPGHPGRRFQLDCRHRVAALSGHTGLLARSACLLGSQSTFPSFSNQLAMENFKIMFPGHRSWSTMPLNPPLPIARACLPKDNR